MIRSVHNVILAKNCFKLTIEFPYIAGQYIFYIIQLFYIFTLFVVIIIENKIYRYNIFSQEKDNDKLPPSPSNLVGDLISEAMEEEDNDLRSSFIKTTGIDRAYHFGNSISASTEI